MCVVDAPFRVPDQIGFSGKCSEYRMAQCLATSRVFSLAFYEFKKNYVLVVIRSLTFLK